MKKVLKAIIIGIKGLLLYLTVMIDRFSMAPFIGIPLPDTNYKKDVPVVDENTTDEQIEQIVDIEDRLKVRYKKDYIPKAIRRSIYVTTTILSYCLFTILSWTTLAIIAGIGVLTVTSILVSRRWTIKRTKKNEE